ncbi:DALR anticodon-binding domain-containing protein [Frankia sp. Cj5]|uniref:DALR anticodon-binding domain-containing protein n=1 Tax=Frankia sp. Cj5 TaxID=2880978 RepID=UPI001EF6C3E3|nr:DALR anticodon-binding domain-containing protein [Frankia sp. Cj5]
MTPDGLAEVLRAIIGQLVADGALDVVIPTVVPVERLRFFDRGDYATPIALRLARSARRSPREVAEAVAGRLRQDQAVAAVAVAGPGFLNIRLAGGALGEIARTVVRAGGSYGCGPAVKGWRGPPEACATRANAETGYAHPAGPVTLAAARRAAVADASARLLDAAGGQGGGLAGIGAVTAAAGEAQPGRPGGVRRDRGPIGQRVTLTRGGAPVRTLAWAGGPPLIDDLVDAVGADAARYWLVRVPLDSALVLDLDVIAGQTDDNPFFCVQHAHARIRALLRSAGELGLSLDAEGADVLLLTHPREGDLLRALGELPRVVRTAADRRAPYRVARYLEELAGTYRRFHGVCRVLPQGDERAGALGGARLLLAEATRTVLASGLRLLGVPALTRM